ncbi:MAG: hypothetical protein LQ347_006435 [Umbilicaria vellea]|nr:MAG: hypothetical protein LQ347_006435 [Umbilicaria vellea]
MSRCSSGRRARRAVGLVGGGLVWAEGCEFVRCRRVFAGGWGGGLALEGQAFGFDALGRDRVLGCCVPPFLAAAVHFSSSTSSDTTLEYPLRAFVIRQKCVQNILVLTGHDEEQVRTAAFSGAKTHVEKQVSVRLSQGAAPIA